MAVWDAPLGTTDGLFTLLGRNPEEIIGHPETEILDFKKAHYQLDREDQKFELAKDLTAMANSPEGEGVILIGVETTHDGQSHVERASALRPLADGAFGEKQVRDVIQEWVFPRLHVDIQCHPAREGQPGDLWTLHPKRRRDVDFPYLVKREPDGQARSRRFAFFVYERSGSDNRPTSPEQVHEWISRGAGSALDAALPPRNAGEVDDHELALQDDLEGMEMGPDIPYYFIQLSLPEVDALPRFYRGEQDSFFDALCGFTPLRRDGFHHPTGRRPEPTSLAGWRMRIPGHSCLSVTHRGTTTAIMHALMLTWAYEHHSRDKEHEFWINPLALTEFTLESCRLFTQEVLGRAPAVKRFRWRLGMRNLKNGGVVVLPAGRVRKAHEVAGVPSLPASPTLASIWMETNVRDPGALAHLILSKAYAHFHLGGTAIPYSDGSRVLEKEIG